MIPDRWKRHVLKFTLQAFRPLGDWRDWYRASGNATCPVCLEKYCLHPEDRFSEPGLVLLCNGDRVKL
jgi:hypothetical protein